MLLGCVVRRVVVQRGLTGNDNVGVGVGIARASTGILGCKATFGCVTCDLGDGGPHLCTLEMSVQWRSSCLRCEVGDVLGSVVLRRAYSQHHRHRLRPSHAGTALHAFGGWKRRPGKASFSRYQAPFPVVQAEIPGTRINVDCDGRREEGANTSTRMSPLNALHLVTTQATHSVLPHDARAGQK